MQRAMTIETVRQICRAFPAVTEDIKWGDDLVFSVGGKMFTVVGLEPPHSVAFKCTAGTFVELVERDGIIPAPYLARAMWVQEQELGQALDSRELQQLIGASYELVLAKLPKARRPAVKLERPIRRARPSGPSLGQSRRRRG